jgi:ubiquitin C-terminal hydrolase
MIKGKAAKVEAFIPYSQSIQLEKVDYKLYGIVKHIGKYEGGHYVSFICIDGIWYKFNDHAASTVGWKDAMSVDGFLFFYEKVT